MRGKEMIILKIIWKWLTNLGFASTIFLSLITSEGVYLLDENEQCFF